MHPFSIDYITQNSAYGQHIAAIKDFTSRTMAGSDCGPGMMAVADRRQTPSPSDSGMDSSPASDDTIFNDNSQSIAEVLLSLDKVKDDTDEAERTDKKPTHSYIALISKAILSTPNRKALLCDIYQYIMDHFSYYNNKAKAWRNSIRHNLSLNECFIKNGRADNGKGNYWSIHPACEADFAKGDFRRRQARRRARRSSKDASVSELPSNYKYNVGYVPMTSYNPYGATLYSLPSYTPTTQSQAQAHVHPLLGSLPSSSAGSEFQMSASNLSQISQLPQGSYLPTTSGSVTLSGAQPYTLPTQPQVSLAGYQALGLLAQGVHSQSERQTW